MTSDEFLEAFASQFQGNREYPIDKKQADYLQKVIAASKAHKALIWSKEDNDRMRGT